MNLDLDKTQKFVSGKQDGNSCNYDEFGCVLGPKIDVPDPVVRDGKKVCFYDRGDGSYGTYPVPLDGQGE